MSRFSFVLLVSLALSPAAAFAQRCDAAVFGDGVCDCGCGSIDSDCPGGATFVVCARSHCPAGQVPWEHNPDQCMSSACGDGWNDPARGEACDDGNALASGGCNATCSAVNAGWTCGERAGGCHLAPVDAGNPDAGTSGPPDAGTSSDAGVPDAGMTGAVEPMSPAGGCSTTPGVALALLLAPLLRRRAR
ncbi:MAG: hypothetical protein ACOZQL_18065 [Myxococcota bacterium]